MGIGLLLNVMQICGVVRLVFSAEACRFAYRNRTPYRAYVPLKLLIIGPYWARLLINLDDLSTDPSPL